MMEVMQVLEFICDDLTLALHPGHVPARGARVPASMSLGTSVSSGHLPPFKYLVPSLHFIPRTYLSFFVSPSGNRGSKPAHLGGGAPWLAHCCRALCLTTSGPNGREQKVARGSGAGESAGTHSRFCGCSEPRPW